MAKFFTVDGGKTFYNADHVLKIESVNPDNSVITFIDGQVAQAPRSAEAVLHDVRSAL